MKKVIFASLLFALCAGISGAAEAQPYDIEPKGHCPICERAESQKWLGAFGGRMVRGLTNAGLGWTNLIVQPKNAVSEGDNLLIGMGKGLWNTALRTVQGALEFAVSWMPPARDEPVRNCALGDLGITER